jgi:N4-gp56 family major capsid protein
MAELRNGLPVVGYGEGAGINQTSVTIKPDAYYDMMLLKMLRQMEFHYAKYAIQKTLPKNYGDTINWRRFKKLELAPNLGLLTEGVTPVGKEGISGESITAVIQQYGEVMYFTDLVDIQQLDDVRREYTIELGYIAQETLDRIVRNVLVSEGSVYFAGAAATFDALVGAPARPKIDDFRKVVLGFKKDFVAGTRGAAGKYVALISPEVMFALFDDERMLQYMNFGQTNAPLQDGMAIDMFGIRFEEVLNAPVVQGMHDSIILADEAYAITKLAGEGNVRVITKGLGSAGVQDPLDQRQSIGYKITGFSAKVLRPESVVNYWSSPTAAGTVDLTSVTQQAGARITPLKGALVKVTIALGAGQTAYPNGAVGAIAIPTGIYELGEVLQLAGFTLAAPDATAATDVFSNADLQVGNAANLTNVVSGATTVYWKNL